MTGLLGRTFGGYELAHKLGGDGIAEVYRAQPIRSSGREMVVKIIYPEFARQPGFTERFNEVIAAASRLNHPHILPLVSSGEQNGYLYLITPFVAGGTLRDWLTSGKHLGAHDVAPFFRQVCEAASYAHSQGVIHGNIKPANMFLHEGRHLLLGDFGRLWDVRQIDMSHAGSGIEAVEYLAPEALEGTPDQRSDIYSLGAVLFAGLTGHPPFIGNTPFEIFNQHARASIPRLADVGPPLASAVLPLDEVIAGAMAKAPEARYPSALKLAQAIETRLRTAPVRPEALPAAGGLATPLGPVSFPGVAMAAHPAMPLPSHPSPLPGTFRTPGTFGLPGGPGILPGQPPLGGQVANGGFQPLPPALEVEPEMELGRAEGVGRALGELGELARPSSGGQAGVARFAAGTNFPVDLPTGRVPAPRIPGGPQAPISVPPRQIGIPLPASGDPAAQPTFQMPATAGMPPGSGPRWAPFAPAPAGGAPALARAPTMLAGFAPPPAPIFGAGARPAEWFAPAGESSRATPSGQGAGPRVDGTADDWFGIERVGFAPPVDQAAHVGSAMASDHPFSPTRLGLPRLSTPDLGRVPPSWRDTVSDPSSPSMAYGTSSAERGAAASSGQWTGESERWTESNQWGSEPGYWSESGDWVSEPGYRQETGEWRGGSRPGASTEHTRWADSRADSRNYAASSAAYSTPSAAYSAYGPAATDQHWDRSSAPRSASTARGRDEDERHTPRGQRAAERRRADPYDDDAAYADDASASVESFGNSSAYMPMPVAARGNRPRRPAASQALERAPSRRIAPVLVLVVLLLLAGGTAIVAARPELCPQNRCMAAHAALARGLAKLGIGAHASTAPSLSATPAHLTLQVAPGSSVSATMTVVNTTSMQNTWTVTSSLAWLAVTPPSGAIAPGANAQLTLKASPAATLAPQTYNTTLQITSGGMTLSVPVTITVAATK